MTTIQKTLITAALIASVGAGIYEAKESAAARAEVRTLQAQQVPLAEQVRQLQAERDRATNRIAGLKEELAKNEKNNSELLKLRGEVGVLRNKLKQTNDATLANVSNSKTLASEIKMKEMQVNACINNLRQIDAAMQQFALEHGLTETNIVTVDEIAPYLKEPSLQCPSGGTYKIGKMSEVPTCSIPGHTLPSNVDSPAMGLKFSSLKSAIEKDRFAVITSADIKAAIQSYKQFHNGQSPQSQGEWLLYLSAYGSTYQTALEAYLKANNSQVPTNAIDLLPYWQN